MLLKSLKIGFVGTGNMGQALIKGMVESEVIRASQVCASNRSEGKLQKIAATYGIRALKSNQDVIDESDVVFIGVKPQDFFDVLDPIIRDFRKGQIVVSLAAGVPLENIERVLPECRLVRVMPNTPTFICQGTLGFCTLNSHDEGLVDLMEQLLEPLGVALHLEEGEPFDGLTVSCGSGPGFIFELMKYWKDWIIDYGIDEKMARQMTLQTFLGTALLAVNSPKSSFEELRARVTSKQGVTAAGLDSMREQELERVFRIAFEKALLRNKELSRLK